jgi:hypothetical protein
LLTNTHLPLHLHAPTPTLPQIPLGIARLVLELQPPTEVRGPRNKPQLAQGKTRHGVIVQNVAVADLSAHYPTRDDHGEPVKLMTTLSSPGFVLVNPLLYDACHSYSTILFLTLVASGGCVACPSRSQFLDSCPATVILLADLCFGAAESVRSTRSPGVSHSINEILLHRQ